MSLTTSLFMLQANVVTQEKRGVKMTHGKMRETNNVVRFFLSSSLFKRWVGLLTVPLLLGLYSPSVQARPQLTWWVGQAKELRLSLKLQGFVRPEWQSNRGDYRFSNEDSDFYVASRIRIGGEIEWRKNVGVRIIVQDARFWGNGLSEGGKVRFTTETPDQFTREVFFGVQFFEAVIFLRWPDANVTFEAGRMRLVYGNNFLLGDPGFLPPGQSFDGMRLRWTPGNFRIDFKWLLIRESVAASNRPNCQGACFWEGDHMAGTYIQYKKGQHTADLYGYYYQRAPRTTSILEPSRIAFVGLRYFFKNSIVRAHAETQLQAGQHRQKELLAASGIVDIRFTLPVQVKPYLEVQLFFATGDGDPTDDRDNNFIALFNNRRGIYGMVNLYGLSNIIQPMIRLGVQPHSQVRMLADVRYNWKFHPTGTMVGGGSHRPFLTDLTGQDGRDLGTEINVRLMYDPFPGITLDFMGGVFLPTQALSNRDINGQVSSSFGTDPAFMLYTALWLNW